MRNSSINRGIGLLLFATYLYALIVPVYPYIEYVLNQNYIATVLCINKEKPEMHCNGKCYLVKQLKKVNPSEKKEIPPKIDVEKYPLGFIESQIGITKSNTFVCLISYKGVFKIKDVSATPLTPPPKEKNSIT